jgi:hypothetical protein
MNFRKSLQIPALETFGLLIEPLLLEPLHVYIPAMLSWMLRI